jgi:hypothetical protein
MEAMRAVPRDIAVRSTVRIMYIMVNNLSHGAAGADLAVSEMNA